MAKGAPKLGDDQKTVMGLSDCKFYVPEYQREYRWGTSQVRDLLDDIEEFDDDRGTYCLQPIVVRWDAEHERYDLIDGQQRLTTLYIIQQYAYQSKGGKPYAIEYQARPNSREFLEERLRKQREPEDDLVPDFFYMRKAWNAIEQWCNEREWDEFDFNSKILSIVKSDVSFIWYELPEGEDPKALFRRINDGKVPLTNAELVKAKLISEAKSQIFPLRKSPEKRALLALWRKQVFHIP